MGISFCEGCPFGGELQAGQEIERALVLHCVDGTEGMVLATKERGSSGIIICPAQRNDIPHPEDVMATIEHCSGRVGGCALQLAGFESIELEPEVRANLDHAHDALDRNRVIPNN